VHCVFARCAAADRSQLINSFVSLGQSLVEPAQHDELRLLVNSRHPIITVETPEEERLEQLALEVASELAVPMYTWSVTAGLAKAHGAPIYNTDSPEQAVANIALIQGDAIFLRAFQ